MRCANCGQGFSGQRRYCSLACAREHRKKRGIPDEVRTYYADAEPSFDLLTRSRSRPLR